MITSTNGEERQTKKRLWTEEEDMILVDYVNSYGKGQWNRLAKRTGLKRCGKSCRLRWMNYLCPDVNQGDFTEEENDIIIWLHRLLGNRWSLITKRVPGRTDNQVKNHWNTHLNKKLREIRADGSSNSAIVGEGSGSSSSPWIRCSTPDQSMEVTGKPQTEPLLVKDGHVGSLCVPDHGALDRGALELSAFGCWDFLDDYYFNLDSKLN